MNVAGVGGERMDHSAFSSCECTAVHNLSSVLSTPPHRSPALSSPLLRLSLPAFAPARLITSRRVSPRPPSACAAARTGRYRLSSKHCEDAVNWALLRITRLAASSCHIGGAPQACSPPSAACPPDLSWTRSASVPCLPTSVVRCRLRSCAADSVAVCSVLPRPTLSFPRLSFHNGRVRRIRCSLLLECR